MGNLELILNYTKKIESLLDNKLGASGRGLYEKMSSVESVINDERITFLIRKIATIRNKSVHEDGYVFQDSYEFESNAKEVIEHLEMINFSEHMNFASAGAIETKPTSKNKMMLITITIVFFFFLISLVVIIDINKTNQKAEKNNYYTANEVAQRNDLFDHIEPKPEIPSATELMSKSTRMTSLQAKVDRALEVQEARRPSQKWISASTREYKYASYMEAWRAKVERIGNINYPDAARRGQLSGSLILDVALNPDGTINEIIVKKSSGHQVLDAAAIHIVRLSSPFSVFPDNIRKDVDILHITQTWKFLDNSTFSGK